MIYGLYKLFEEMMAFTLNRNPPNEENKEQEQPEPNVSLFSKIANKKEAVNQSDKGLGIGILARKYGQIYCSCRKEGSFEEDRRSA
jgi:hypothetical protein